MSRSHLFRRLKQHLRAQVGGLPRPYWWIWFGTLINRAGTFIEPFVVLYLTGPRNIDVHVVGVVLTVWGLGSTLSQPFGGFCADRFGRRLTLGLGLAGSAAMMLLLSVTRGVWQIALVVFVLGLVADTYRPASSSAIVDLVDEDDRSRAFSLQFWAVNLGFSIASVAAGVLLHHFGYSLLFVLDACTTLAFGLLALWFIPETKPQHTEHEPARLLDPFRLLRADRLAAVATGLVLIYAVLYSQVGLTLPLAVKDAGLSPSVYGYVAAINGILIVIVQPLTLRWLDRRERRVTLPIGMALVGFGIALTGLCHSAWQFGVTVVIWTLGEIATAGSFQVIVAELAPAHMRGRYAGAIGLSWGLSGLVGPLISTTIYAASPAALWISCLIAGVVSGLGQRTLLRKIKHRTTANPTLKPAIST